MHDIGALHLSSSRWIDRRVDRFEFVGLTTIHHTITLTLDLRWLATDTVTLPIGMFGRQRPPGQVVDAAGAVVRHLSSGDANALLEHDVLRRLAQLGITRDVAAQLSEIARHRADRCDRLMSGPSLDGYAELASEKWGCPTVGVLLRELAAVPGTPREVNELVRLLFDWQNCDPLIVEIDTANASFGTLIVSFDEELTPWFSPWDRRRAALTRTEHRDRDTALSDRAYAALVSRGGPFQADLNLLVPRPAPRRWLSRNPVPWLRRLGRLDVRHLMWHVAWEQWAVGSVERHVEVVVPPELAVVRLRSLRPNGAAPDLADQVGPRAHITLMPEQREPPELMSVILCHRDGHSWTAGAVIALITGTLLVLAVWFQLERIDAQMDAAATVILLGPAFTAGLLSARATSEIADTLLIGLRRLLAASAICIALSAAFLVATTELVAQVAVTILAGVLMILGALLAGGAWRSRKLRREAQERERPSDSPRDQRLAAGPRRQRTPRPDRFIVSGEGERMPWGWLESPEGGSSLDLDSRDEDKLYWSRVFASGPDRTSIATLIEFGRGAAKASDESRPL